MPTEPALVLGRNAEGRLRVIGSPPKTHSCTADQFAKFVATGHVHDGAVVLDAPGGGDVVYRVDVDDETGFINLHLEG